MHRTHTSTCRALGALLLCMTIMHTISLEDCEELLTKYLRESKDPAPYNGSTLLYFLHIPRTAGRSFHSCFVLPGTPIAQRCPRSYDHMRVDLHNPDCKLLSSHDDYSIMSSLPEEVAVFSQFRDPVDRFLSSYEFAIEHAAVLRNPDTSQPIGAENVWPWKVLIPFFIDDINRRMDKLVAKDADGQTGGWSYIEHPDGEKFYYNAFLGKSKWTLNEEEHAFLLPPLDPYNSSEVVMPLHEFIEHPLAKELLHNGEFFQLLGISNFSRYEYHTELRECINSHEAIREQLGEVAHGRMRKFTHVGVTDRLFESVQSAAVSLNRSLEGPSYAAITKRRKQNLDGAVEEPAGNGAGQIVKGDPLGVDFLKCTLSAQIRNNRRRALYATGLQIPDGRKVQFSREARKKIKPEVIERLRQYNALDLSLHKYASELLEAKMKVQEAAGQLQKLPNVTVDPTSVSDDRGPKPRTFVIPKPKDDGHEDL